MLMLLVSFFSIAFLGSVELKLKNGNLFDITLQAFEFCFLNLRRCRKFEM